VREREGRTDDNERESYRGWENNQGREEVVKRGGGGGEERAPPPRGATSPRMQPHLSPFLFMW
jgi:hypothetical protein